MLPETKAGRTRWRQHAGWLLLLSLPAWPQQREQPVGLVLAPGDGKLLRAGSELPLGLRAGEMLFVGDTVRTGGSAASLLFCPDKSIVEVLAGSDVWLASGGLKVRTGRLGARTAAASCILPQTIRVDVASQQHYGVTMVRALRPGKVVADTLAAALQSLPELERLRIAGELAGVQQALAALPDDPAPQLALAAILERNQLFATAASAYRALAARWPDAAWIQGKVFRMEEAAALAEAAAAAKDLGGRTYALLVGVSNYQKLPKDLWLQYAHADATLFASHLKSPRGGGLPDGDVTLLVNQNATTPAIRNAFETFLKGRAGPKDTVVLFIAAHGMAIGKRDAYILTWDSNPEDPATSALPMADIHNLLREGLKSAGRVLAFVDVCRAGAIGGATSPNRTVAAAVERMAEVEGELLGLMASRASESSLEGPDFGGGHGAFSYYLVKGLAGEADKNGDGVVDANEVINYVSHQVAQGTSDKQHPQFFGDIKNAVTLSDKRKPGIDITRFPLLRDARGEPIRLTAQSPQAAGSTAAIERNFAEAVVTAPRKALGDLPEMKRRLEPEAYLGAENRLRVALEERGQQVLLRYLAGDQTPQTRADFAEGAAYFQAARQLTPESVFLAAREVFCRGRTRLFDKDYSGATDLLERAAMLDPSRAYAFNALGIAYLEQADYARAVLGFRDAVRRAPYWAYPRHNLALAYAELGNYGQAVATYKEAMRLAPSYSYLPYNLGLLYQRLDRKREAQEAYRRASEIAPDAPAPYTALASLYAASNKAAEAERTYRQALAKQADFLPARHNLALLLDEKPQRRAEAVALWRANLAQSPGYLPSRLALADSLATSGQTAEAIEQYRIVIEQKPDYLGAYLAAADLRQKTGDIAGAITTLGEASRRQPENAQLHERIGDLEHSRGREAEARAGWQAALDRMSRAQDQKRVARKLKASLR